MIIVVAHIKGGTGKTTVATQLALCRKISTPGRKVWLIDADEQQSASDTISIRAEQMLFPSPDCGSYGTGKELLAQLNRRARDWDDVIIDCGGRDTDTLRVAMLAADKLIVPVLPRAYDLWSLVRLGELIEKARPYRKRPLPAYAFVNRKDRTAECREAVEQLDAIGGFVRMQSSFSDRMAYAKACGQGRSVMEMKPLDKKAVGEVRAFCEEVFSEPDDAPGKN